MRKLINKLMYKKKIYKKERFPYNIQDMLAYMRETGKTTISQLTEQEASMFLIK